VLCVEFCARLGKSRNDSGRHGAVLAIFEADPKSTQVGVIFFRLQNYTGSPGVSFYRYRYSRLALCTWGDLGRRTGRRDARFLERNYPRRFELVHLMLKDLDRALQAPSEGFDRDISSPLNLTLAHHC
jgi:hypothetical protein